MAPRYKFNPRTGKFEPPTTDPKTGLPLDASGNVVPVTVPKPKTMTLDEMQAAAAAYLEKQAGPAPTTTTVPKKATPTTTSPPLRYAPNDTPTDNRPKAPTVSPTTTMAPKNKNSTTTTTVPKNSTTSTTAPPNSTTSTTVPKNSTTTTTVPKNSTTTTTVPANPTVTTPPVVISSTDIQGIVDKMIAGSALTPAELAAMTALSGGSTASAAATAATKAAKKEVDDANSYRAGQAAAGIQEQAGMDAQTQYGALAKTQYDTARTAADTIYTPAVKNTNDYYDKQISGLQTYIDAQNKSATGSIDSATAELLAGLKGTTAYNDVVGANTAAPTQGLGDMLKSYGATGNAAATQQASDAAYGKQIADVFTKGNTQLAGAETDYYTGLQNAAKGAQAAGKQNLAEVLARLQGQDRSAIEGNRRAEISNLDATKSSAYNSASDLQNQLLGKGIDALMSGKSTAASTRAQTTASYGVPKKPKAKPKPKK